jgi:hypothetical protein
MNFERYRLESSGTSTFFNVAFIRKKYHRQEASGTTIQASSSVSYIQYFKRRIIAWCHDFSERSPKFSNTHEIYVTCVVNVINKDNGPLLGRWRVDRG